MLELKDKRWAGVYILDIVTWFSSPACTRTYWSLLVTGYIKDATLFVLHPFVRLLFVPATLTTTSLSGFRRDHFRILQDV